jgi:DNA-binding response OmpR family regulator
VVITGASSVSSAVEAIKMGAFDYVEKPFTDDKIKSVVGKALKVKEAALMKEGLEAFDPEQGRLIQKQEIIRVLERASKDMDFRRALIDQGSEALSRYRLTSEAKAAIISGDLNWVRKNAGDLTDEQLKWIRSRLEMEQWS